MNSRHMLIAGALALLLGSCSEAPNGPVDAGIGPSPNLPEPTSRLIPNVNIATAKRWEGDAQPTPASGLAVNAFARDLDHPRWLYVLPNGDVLVAESNAPPRSGGRSGISGWFMKMAQKRAGAAVPSANRITLLRDADGDGIAETRSVFLKGLNSPFGMTLIGDNLYVANTDAVMRFPYSEGQTQIDRARRQGCGLAGRAAQPPLDQESDRQPRRLPPLRDGGIEQRSRRERHRQGGASRRRSSKSIWRTVSRGCLRRGCAIRMDWDGSRRPACCGRS